MGLAETVVVLICTLGTFVAGLCGVGGFMLSMPVMALFFPFHTVVLACSMAAPCLCLLLLARYAKYCRWRSRVPMLMGAVPGAVVGVWIIATVDGAVLQLILGLVMLVFLVWQQWGKRAQGGESWRLGGLTGFISGILGTSISVDGAPVGAYGLYAGWSPFAFMGTVSCYYFLRSILSFVAQASAGLYNAEVAHVAMYVLIGSVIGTLLSFPVLNRCNVTVFRNIVKIVLLFAAFSSLWNARGLFGLDN